MCCCCRNALFSKLFLFHFFYCKAIKKKHSSPAFSFRSVSLFCASNVRIHQKQKTKNRRNEIMKIREKRFYLVHYYCRPSYFAQYSRKLERNVKNRGNCLSVILWHCVHFLYYLLSLYLSQLFSPYLYFVPTIL